MQDESYSSIIPVSYLDVGICFYCGCESEFSDYVPPIRYKNFYIRTNETAVFSSVPCCKECLNFLNDCDQGTVEERKIHVNDRIGAKYSKALTIFKRWDESEIIDLDESFAISIRAGIILGSESQSRMRYSGFEYEINGSLVRVDKREDVLFDVFGEIFDDYNHALKYASKAYKINIVVLEEWLKQTEADFCLAIDSFFANQKKQLFEKNKSKLCRAFSKKHAQNSKLMRSMLDSYLDMYPEYSVEYCLQLMLEERIRGTNNGGEI